MDFVSEMEILLREIDDDFDPPLSSSVNIAEYSKKMFDNATIFSVHESGKLVGSMAVYSNDPLRQTAFGTMLAVSKSHRSFGLGPNLIKTTVDYLRKKSFQKFRLEIYKTNPRVITLYKRLKFCVVEETNHSVFVELKLN